MFKIKESDKDNDASIGNTPKINNEIFGSIDELLACFVAPMNDCVEELIEEHRKFVACTVASTHGNVYSKVFFLIVLFIISTAIIVNCIKKLR